MTTAQQTMTTFANGHLLEAYKMYKMDATSVNPNIDFVSFARLMQSMIERNNLNKVSGLKYKNLAD